MGQSAATTSSVDARGQQAVPIPVIASGGAGDLQHMADVLAEGRADAVLAASIFHFGEYTVGRCETVFEGEREFACDYEHLR